MGTVDFIFGNAAMVMQNCNIMPREPMPNQFNTITAQGKKDPNQKTGISIIGCVIMPYLNKTLTAQTYLGRPWKNYSTTVIMETQIDKGFLHPKGWIPWDSINGTTPDTIFYGEYKNTGPGSDTTHRVKWHGYTENLTQSHASLFTVENFIFGPSWLNATRVPYDRSL